MGYLDETGLSRVWNRIKAYIQSLNYTSNIGTVTGITMNNTSYSPIDGDVDIGTVVTDVSSKANDSEVVHTTGDETIFQKKTFAANGEIHLASGWNQIYNEDDDESLQEALNARNNVQADWNQTTTTALDYIKNKPNIPTIPTNVSAFTNDAGYITGYTETDPTVPSWAKASTKPSYTAAEIGAVPTTRTVNGKALSADISLTASDVGALPSSTVIPAAQVNSDWNASSGVAQILNKPTIPTVPTTLSSFTDDLGSSPTHTHSQYLTSETEPDFNGSAAATITSSDISNWNGKTSNVGTITGITMNGTSKGTSGVVDLGTVLTEHQSLTNYVQKNNTSGLLKNDGTVDTNTYLTTETEPAYT